MSILLGNVIRRYISTSPKRKLRNNIDVIVYFAGNNEVGQRALQQRISISIAPIFWARNIDIVSISAMAISTHLYYSRTRGYTSTRHIPEGTGRAGYLFYGYGSGTGTTLRVQIGLQRVYPHFLSNIGLSFVTKHSWSKSVSLCEVQRFGRV